MLRALFATVSGTTLFSRAHFRVPQTSPKKCQPTAHLSWTTFQRPGARRPAHRVCVIFLFHFRRKKKASNNGAGCEWGAAARAAHSAPHLCFFLLAESPRRWRSITSKLCSARELCTCVRQGTGVVGAREGAVGQHFDGASPFVLQLQTSVIHVAARPPALAV